MAFVETSAWRADGERAGRPSLIELYLPPWIDHPLVRQFHWRRPAGMVLAVLLHILLIWALLTRTEMGPGEGSRQGDGGSLKMIDLSASTAEDDEPEQETKPAATTPAQSVEKKTELDISAPGEIPPEWSVTKIRVALPVTTDPPSSSPALSSSTNSMSAGISPSGGMAGDGGNVYDPYAYAGAAPRRYTAKLPVPVGMKKCVRYTRTVGQTASMLDLDVLERACAAVRRRFPSAAGSADLSARISPTGQVLGLVVKKENVGADALALMRQELMGRALFQVRSNVAKPTVIDLPKLDF